MTEALLIAVLIVGIANLALVILLIGGRRDAARDIDRLKRDMLDEQRALRAEVSENTRRSINAVGETLLNEYQRDTLNQEQRFKTFALENAQRMEQIRRSVERQLADIREDNGKKLDEMRSIVDEKLQKTLEDKLSRSFALVSERLEQVYKGLGEMQTLASGVGDLSKVLSNVKTRGILGEIQLGAILGEMMAPEQFKVPRRCIHQFDGRIRAGQCGRSEGSAGRAEGQNKGICRRHSEKIHQPAVYNGVCSYVPAYGGAVCRGFAT